MRTERSTPRRLLRRATTRRRRRREGAVYAEAVIVLGTMVLLLALIFFVHDGFVKATVAGTQTRQHGWAHVMEPCENGVPSPTQQREEGSWGIGSLAALAFIAADGVQVIGFQALIVEYWDLLSFKIDSHRFSQSGSLGRPPALGGEARFGHQIVLSCDEDPDDMKMQSWKFGLWTMTAWYQAGL